MGSQDIKLENQDIIEIERFEETNRLWEKATQKEWDELDEAINSMDMCKIKKCGERLNQSLLIFRLQNSHLFV